MIDRNEIEEVIESFGLKYQEYHEELIVIYQDWAILIYDKGNRKASIWPRPNEFGFGDYLYDKETVRAELGKVLKMFKVDKMKKKISVIEGDFE